MSGEVESLFRESGLVGQAESIDEGWLLGVLSAGYGIEGELKRIETEKDNTYHLRGLLEGELREFLVKVSPPQEPLEIVQCQIDAIAWIEQREPTIPVQTLVADRSGALSRRLSDPGGRPLGVLRVHVFLPGPLLISADPHPAQLRAVGAMLGRVDTALQDFAHPGAQRVLAWDLSRFMSFESLVALEPDPRRRELAQTVFDGFAARVVPQLPTARTQVIHGDFSPYNVVVDPAVEGYVSGVIDFGDTIRTPVVFDPAVLLGNHLGEAPAHPWRQARELLAGYEREFPLSVAEVGMVIDASLARVVLRALIASWRLRQGTDRAEYVLAHAQHDWIRLENAIDFGYAAALTYLTHSTNDEE